MTSKVDACIQDKLNQRPCVIYEIDWPGGELLFMNKRWTSFATDNGISKPVPMGFPTLEACAPPLADFYCKFFSSAIADNKVRSHVYECSSPDSFREYSMIVYPLTSDGGKKGLVLVNVLQVIRAHDRKASAPLDKQYRNAETGTLEQCASCRRVKQLQSSAEGQGAVQWDWIPEWVYKCPPKTTHVVCVVCQDLYYQLPSSENKEDLVQPTTSTENKEDLGERTDHQSGVQGRYRRG
jgi:hypothetical protein